MGYRERRNPGRSRNTARVTASPVDPDRFVIEALRAKAKPGAVAGTALGPTAFVPDPACDCSTIKAVWDESQSHNGSADESLFLVHVRHDKGCPVIAQRRRLNRDRLQKMRARARGVVKAVREDVT